MNDDVDRKTVVYLLGAGATQASVEWAGCVHGVLMRHLTDPMAEAVGNALTEEERRDGVLVTLVNAIIDDATDYEHIITFLDESPSGIHRQFAARLRTIFERVLRERLGTVEKALGDARFSLYSALLGMHTVEGFDENVKGFLTINYDDHIEQAVWRTYQTGADLGIELRGQTRDPQAVKVLKLHGSFGWTDTWPVSVSAEASTLWIPPGIEKRKERYPFNVLWGLARELLDCDILRIVGCRLSGNDWDLISLLFNTRHAHADGRPYTVEVIDDPRHAFALQRQYPYLDIRSVLEIEEYDVGRELVGELLGSRPRRYEDLNDEEQRRVLDEVDHRTNWFAEWLVLMAEALSRELGSITTMSGDFENLLAH